MTTLKTLDVGELYHDDYFLGGKGDYLDYLSEKPMSITRGTSYAAILSRFVPKPGRLMDVGAAAGFLLEGFVRRGWDGIGVEPNEQMAAYGRTRFGLKMYPGTIESFVETYTGTRYDLVSFIQVIAHLLDPQRVLRSCTRLLRPGGWMLIETWNWRSFTARLAGKRWHEYNSPFVVHWFSKKSLDRLMQDLGFREVARGRPRRKISGRQAKFLINRALAGSAWKKGIGAILDIWPDGRLLPYPGEDLFWALYRKED